MARPYTSQEVNSVISEHKRLRSVMKECESEIEKIRASVRSRMMMFASKDIFRANMKKELTENTDNSSDPDIAFLSENLYRQASLMKCDSGYKEIEKEYGSLVDKAVSSASSMSNPIKWMFTSAKSKNDASESFEYLNSLLQGSYKSRIDENHSLFESIKGMSRDDAILKFRENPVRCEKYLREYINEKNYKLGEVKEINDLFDKVNRIKDRKDGLDEEIYSGKNEIKKACDEYRRKEIGNILSNVPVEAISRDSSGVRIKVLEDAGYTNVAQLASLSKAQLVSINGIGEDNAAAIKNQVDKYINEVASGVRIRLSSDDRSLEFSKLLSAIYSYRRKKEIKSETDSYIKEHEKDINEGYVNLHSASDTLKWFCLTDSQKDGVRKTYDSLKTLLSDEYLKSFESVSDTSKISSVSINDIRADFENDTVGYINILDETVPGLMGDDGTMYGLPGELAEDIRTQSFGLQGLNCTLRPYQEWGVKYVLHQEKVLLGDEMGLGKTIQALACIVALRNAGDTHFMVICPASVLANWIKEINSKTDLRAVKIHGRDRLESFEKWLKEGGVAVTTYETTSFLKYEEGYRFSFLVVDEAHYIKNISAQRSKNVRDISKHADRMLFMTGTALENRVDEMISLIEILNPEISKQVKNIAFMSAAKQFRDKIAPVYYRRKRDDVLTELPEKIENDEWTILLDEEKKIYKADVLAKKYADIRRVSWKVDDLSKSSKAIRLKEIVEEAKSEGRKTIVFSFFLDTMAKVRELLGDCCLEPINGSVPPQKRQEIIDEFDKAPEGSVLCAQIQSGGTGLNIQSASVVVICEPQLKPSIENQAISRAYRMGQARNVLVYRLLSDDTVDEKIMDILKQKQSVFDAFANDSAAAENVEKNDIEQGIDEKTLGSIIDEEIERIKQSKGETDGAKENSTEALSDSPEDPADP